jgi:hypothetical protein
VSVLSSEEVTRAKGYLVTSRKLYHDMQEDLAALIDRGVRDGSFPWGDPGPDARSILAAVLEAFQEQVRDVAPNSADESITQVAGFALRALGADPRLLATPPGARPTAIVDSPDRIPLTENSVFTCAPELRGPMT